MTINSCCVTITTFSIVKLTKTTKHNINRIIYQTEFIVEILEDYLLNKYQFQISQCNIKCIE